MPELDKGGHVRESEMNHDNPNVVFDAGPADSELATQPVNKITWALAGRVTDPGRYMFRFGWLTITGTIQVASNDSFWFSSAMNRHAPNARGRNRLLGPDNQLLHKSTIT